jgi:hypothetical protein
MITAMRIARGDYDAPDWTLLDLFLHFGCTDRSAKIHARKVAEFRLSKYDQALLEMEIFEDHLRQEVREKEKEK